MKEKIFKWGLHILPCVVGLLAGWQHISLQYPREAPVSIADKGAAPQSDLRYVAAYPPLNADTLSPAETPKVVFPLLNTTSSFLFSPALLRDRVLIR
ncbi:hypothetical protein [Compostibacter hankyongensis]|uniref:Uncharacterized protein n=1 Tax=Compostibacter hankyongensis TaxID=1007089 RepID=A0ABP8FUT1_9BACT